MKLLAVAALISCVGVQVFAAITEAENNRFAKIMYDCQQETGVNSDVSFNALQYGMFAEDEKLEDEMECIFKKMDILKDGKIDKNKLVDLARVLQPIKSDQAKEIADKCGDEKGDSIKDTALKITKCIKEQ